MLRPAQFQENSNVYIYNGFPLTVSTSQQGNAHPPPTLTNSANTCVPHNHHFQHPAQHPHMLPTKACRFTLRSTVSSVAHNMREPNRMKNNPTYHSLKLNMPTVLHNWFAFPLTCRRCCSTLSANEPATMSALDFWGRRQRR